jgi:hypothetical protein
LDNNKDLGGRMAKYVSINELDKFRLHDAIFVSVNLQQNNMIWTLKRANVTTENSQNNFDCDMQADHTSFTFYDYHIKNFYINEFQSYDKTGKLINIRPSVPIPASDYEKTILNFPEDNCWISTHDQCDPKDPSLYSFCIIADYAYILEVSFIKILAEWDSFISKAWYVDWGKKN